ncbi:MAG: aminopeptidase P family protein [Candidatus Diapherotrites archaeon]|uniref:Aminopeptidase P family protein n=1 Tax=Candidatus Iainarchaeum sp. TaxID=3101447 RepID=A0A939C4M1_9ARCH|nr:aminopeptidase P family protein [Candidatus Diapherotrites archaeon]
MSEKTKELFDSINAKAVLLKAPDPNFYYFSGLSVGHFFGTALILRQGKKPVLLTTRFYSVPKALRKNLVVKTVENSKKVRKILGQHLKGRRIGLNYNFATKKGYADLRKMLKGKAFFDVSKNLAEVRAVKTSGEISKIRTAVGITEKVLQRVPKIYRRGMTERALALAIELEFRQKADDSIGFPVIVASGANGSVPHHMPSEKRIGKGFLLVDAGCRYRNYCADLSRTFFVGSATERQRELYQAVFASQRFSLSLIKPGEKCSGIFAKAGKFLKSETGFSLIHGLGHGLGIEVHDSPRGFLEGSNERLKPGMVLTVEPAIYGRFGGIRIEDDILVTKTGCRLLSSAPKKLVEF